MKFRHLLRCGASAAQSSYFQYASFAAFSAPRIWRFSQNLYISAIYDSAVVPRHVEYTVFMKLNRAPRTASAKNIPVGTAPPYETLPAVKVKNEVVYVRKGVNLPFRVEMGKSCDLGLFLTQNPDPSEQTFPMGVMTQHARSGLVGRVVFSDTDGRMWRDINLKGVGGSQVRQNGKRVDTADVRGVTGDAPHGLCDWGYAETDREKSEYFLKRGMRTHLVPFIIKLKEIILTGGEKVSIAEARRRGILAKDVIPVIEARAFRTQARIINAFDKALLDDAIQLVAEELGIPTEKFSPEAYLEWFANEFGRQLAILHNSEHSHRYLTTHNVTLACEITDLDSVGRIPRGDDGSHMLETDLLQAESALRELYHAMASRYSETLIGSAETNLGFVQSYVQNLKEPVLQRGRYDRYVRRIEHRCRMYDLPAPAPLGEGKKNKE